MTIRRWWKRGLGVVGVAALLGVVVLFQDGSAEDASDAPEAAPARAVNVEVVAVTPRPFTERVRVTGRAEAMQDVQVAAEESGVIRQLFVEKGAMVRAGQALARIDDRVIRAQHEEAKANAMLAAETFERQRRLWEDERIGTEMAFLEAKYRAQTAAAAAEVAQARLERTVVRAPITGVVDDRFVEVGSMVAPGSAVARLLSVGEVKVAGGVPERYATEIAKGSAIRVELPVLAGQWFEGQVRFVGSALEPESRTIPVEVVIPNPGGLIKPGMVANLTIARRSVEDALVVPQEAVRRVTDGYAVMVAEPREGGFVAQQRAVVTGGSESGEVLVTSGLEAGERVIVVGHQQVGPGDVLRVKEREAEPND